MCGRVIQSSAPVRLAIVEGMDARDSRVHNYPPRWNGAPSQDLLVIRRNRECVVADAVGIEPVSYSNSLLTGKFTGNLVECCTLAGSSCYNRA